MTVCLAALCQDAAGQPAVVVSADRMVTLGGFMEFEHAVPKMVQPSQCSIVMIAGDTLAGTRLARDVAGGMNGTPRITDIAALLAGHYAAVRLQSMEQALLTPRALTIHDFYARHQQMNPQVTMMLDQGMAQYNLGVELLLAGVDDTGAHIFTVHNPGGRDALHDVIGYAAVGSGAIHAIQAMVGFRHEASCSLADTVFRVYAAKRRGESAPGVGNDSDLVVITGAGARALPPDALAQLDHLYQQHTTAAEGAIDEQLEAMNLDPAVTDEAQLAPPDVDEGA